MIVSLNLLVAGQDLGNCIKCGKPILEGDKTAGWTGKFPKGGFICVHCYLDECLEKAK